MLALTQMIVAQDDDLHVRWAPPTLQQSFNFRWAPPTLRPIVNFRWGVPYGLIDFS